MKSVLIVDDSLYMRTVLVDMLKGLGFTIIFQASNGEEAIDMAFEEVPDLITLDNILPDMIGIDILKVFIEEELSSKVIMISAVGQDAIIKEATNLGAKYIIKPLDVKVLEKTIEEFNEIV